MSEYYAEQKDLKKSGEKIKSWGYGYGGNPYPTIKKKGVWCVMFEGRIYAEARGQKACIDIVNAMNMAAGNK